MNLLVPKIQTGVSFFLIVIYFWNSKTISLLNFERLLVTDFCSNNFSKISLSYLFHQLKPIPEISVKNISNFFYWTRFSLNSRVFLSANLAKYIYHQWNRTISYYCRMISVVLSEVSQPSREKRKSFDENFVTAKGACINDGATLSIIYFKWNRQKTIFDTLKFILGSGAWEDKQKKCITVVLSLEMISFVLFSQASQPSMNFNISEVVYYWIRLLYQCKPSSICVIFRSDCSNC